MLDLRITDSAVIQAGQVIRQARIRHKSKSPSVRERAVSYSLTEFVRGQLSRQGEPTSQEISFFKSEIGKKLARRKRSIAKPAEKKVFQPESPEEYAERMSIYAQVENERKIRGAVRQSYLAKKEILA